MGHDSPSKLLLVAWFLQVALLSAKKNAPSVIPWLVFSGEKNRNNVTDWFEKHGGNVIHHTLTFEAKMQELVDAGQHPNWWFEYRGAYLRLDLPLLFPKIIATYNGTDDIDTQFYLYTDTDIMFFQDVNSCSYGTPELFSYGGEAFTKAHAISTGVMVINAHAFEATRASIIDFGVATKFDQPAFDQGLINSYVAEKGIHVPVLDAKYTWRPYWGRFEEAVIVHFHGPKPESCIPCFVEHLRDYKTACIAEEHQCFDAYMPLLELARKADGGRSYFWVFFQYQQLRKMLQES